MNNPEVSIITDNILPKNNMIIHCSGLEDISYYLYAQKFACKNGYAKNRVISISSNDYIDKSPPLFSSLDNSLVQLSRRC